jgi:putative phosphoesterase
MRGCDHILHAGDVGDLAILEQLRHLAPLTAIRGNIDGSGPCSQLPATERIELAGHSIYMLHNLRELDIAPAKAGIAAVVSGHSHKPAMDWHDGVLYFNPGSAGPRRFSLPISVGFLELAPTGIKPKIVKIA